MLRGIQGCLVALPSRPSLSGTLILLNVLSHEKKLITNIPQRVITHPYYELTCVHNTLVTNNFITSPHNSFRLRVTIRNRRCTQNLYSLLRRVKIRTHIGTQHKSFTICVGDTRRVRRLLGLVNTGHDITRVRRTHTIGLIGGSIGHHIGTRLTGRAEDTNTTRRRLTLVSRLRRQNLHSALPSTLTIFYSLHRHCPSLSLHSLNRVTSPPLSGSTLCRHILELRGLVRTGE